MQPAVWLAARDMDDGTTIGSEVDHFREYVRPVESNGGDTTRQLSEYCTTLTGITQSTIDGASPCDARRTDTHGPGRPHPPVAARP